MEQRGLARRRRRRKGGKLGQVRQVTAPVRLLLRVWPLRLVVTGKEGENNIYLIFFVTRDDGELIYLFFPCPPPISPLLELEQRIEADVLVCSFARSLARWLPWKPWRAFRPRAPTWGEESHALSRREGDTPHPSLSPSCYTLFIFTYVTSTNRDKKIEHLQL